MGNIVFVTRPALTDVGATWHGLDVSWQMMLNYAWIKHWVWGKDIIYTYGPLGFLSTRMGWGVDRWIFICFDLFLVFNFFNIFKDFLQRASDKFLGLLILFCVTLLLQPHYGADLSWVLMSCCFYWMYKTFKEPRFLYFIIIAILVFLSFYIKLNTGLMLFILFVAHLVTLVWSKKTGLIVALTSCAVTIALILIGAYSFHVALAPYIKGAFEIIKGYNDIMYLDEKHVVANTAVFMIFSLLLALFGSYAFRLSKEKKYYLLFLPFICLVYSFLLFKQSVLRNDTGHLYEFIIYAPLILIAVPVDTISSTAGKNILRLHLVIILICIGVISQEKNVIQAIRARYGGQAQYISDYKEFYTSPYLFQQDKRKIPQRVLDKIGNKTVDIFPWDCEYLLENKLNYTPRPVFQSFSAYTPYLANQNYIFYQDHSPDYIIYDYDAIDERYPYNDEAVLNLFLTKNYNFADSFTSNERWRVLLEKKKWAGPISFTPMHEAKMNIGDTILVDGAQLLRIDVKFNLLGVLRSSFYKSPAIRIMLLKGNGEWVGFRTSKELLKAGIMVDRCIMNNGEFVQYMYHPEWLQPVLKVKLVPQEDHFASEMNVKYFKIN